MRTKTVLLQKFIFNYTLIMLIIITMFILINITKLIYNLQLQITISKPETFISF